MNQSAQVEVRSGEVKGPADRRALRHSVDGTEAGVSASAAR